MDDKFDLMVLMDKLAKYLASPERETLPIPKMLLNDVGMIMSIIVAEADHISKLEKEVAQLKEQLSKK
jgi:hypothetical protein